MGKIDNNRYMYTEQINAKIASHFLRNFLLLSLCFFFALVLAIICLVKLNIIQLPVKTLVSKLEKTIKYDNDANVAKFGDEKKDNSKRGVVDLLAENIGDATKNSLKDAGEGVVENKTKEQKQPEIDAKSYNKLVEKLTPSVVHIKGIYLTDTEDENRYKLLHAYDGIIFPPKKIKRQATCSGFFVSADGYIVTNHHCIDDAKSIDVEVKDGDIYDAKIIGYYEGADLAVLKIKPKNGEKFPAVNIGNSDKLSVGDNIIVIGGPLGYKWSATAGIVSGKARNIEYNNNSKNAKKHAWGTAGEYIQVDAAINGGNSGGPVFDLQGNVVGVAAAGYTFLQGMKFIISSNTLSDVLPKLKTGTIISKGLWGVNVDELEPYDVKAIGLEKNEGMLVHEVIEGSPAEQAGLKRGDVIIKVNDKVLKDKVAMQNINSTIMAGDVSKLEINRYGKTMNISVKATDIKTIEKLEKGEVGLQDWDNGNLSFTLLTSKMHRTLRFPRHVKGIVVTDIKNNDDPMLLLAIGDVIMQVNDKKVESIEDYKKIVTELKKENRNMAMFHIYKPTGKFDVVKGSKFE